MRSLIAPAALAFALALVSLAAGAGCAHVVPRKTTPQASSHVAAGVEALANGDLDRAEAEFHMALEYEPRLPHALNGLGLVALRRGDTKTARAWLQAAIDSDDDFAEAHANLGAVLMQEGDVTGALPHLAAALAIDPGYVPARFDLARGLARLGRLKEAREEYMKLTSTVPDSADAFAELAAVELALGHRAAAARAAQRAIELDADQPIAHRVRGDLARDACDWDGALVEYDASLAAAPGDTDAHIGRGMTLLVAGKPVEARIDLERAVALAPSSPAAHFALGVALAADGDDAGAADELARASKLAADAGRAYPEAHYLRAGALARLGKTKAALAEYEQFLHEADGDATLSSAVADAREQMRALRGR